MNKQNNLGYPQCKTCGLIYGSEKHLIKHVEKKHEIITQLCECCSKWVNQEELAWDLEEDRLVCKNCHDSNVVDTK